MIAWETMTTLHDKVVCQDASQTHHVEVCHHLCSNIFCNSVIKERKAKCHSVMPFYQEEFHAKNGYSSGSQRVLAPLHCVSLW